MAAIVTAILGVLLPVVAFVWHTIAVRRREEAAQQLGALEAEQKIRAEIERRSVELEERHRNQVTAITAKEIAETGEILAKARQAAGRPLTRTEIAEHIATYEVNRKPKS